MINEVFSEIRKSKVKALYVLRVAHKSSKALNVILLIKILFLFSMNTKQYVDTLY